MSNVNIQGVISHIKSNTTSYTPIVEMVVNSIQAIEVAKNSQGEVRILAVRNPEQDLFEADSLPDIIGFKIQDNGIGFNDEQRESFDTLFTDLKISQGGKGFGRFVSLKYFNNLRVNSIYRNGDGFMQRTFKMGKMNEIIINENNVMTHADCPKTIVHLDGVKEGVQFEKKLETIARILVDKLLPYFITDDYVCPDIILSEDDGSGEILLNNYIRDTHPAKIEEVKIEKNNFVIPCGDENESFSVRVFKFYFPKGQKSKLCLVAHKREVDGSLLHNYIPEFADEFYEKIKVGKNESPRNYILKAYVFGSYLDNNVSVERGGFEFSNTANLNFPIGQKDIERKSAELAKQAVGEDITFRQEKKFEKVQAYADDNPWYRSVVKDADLSDMKLNPSDDDIETVLVKEKLKQDKEIKIRVRKLIQEGTVEDLEKNVTEIASKASESSKNELIRYISRRKHILEIFDKSLEWSQERKYESEGAVHDIIFPRRSDTDSLPFDNHNLWLIDERLNFTNFLSSDKPLDGGTTERPDLLAYNRSVFFRGENEPSNAITLFEFKKPHREDFIHPSSKDDPVDQIVRYVNNIIDGKYKTQKGREINIAEATPFYGYIVCTLTQKVRTWLYRQKGFKTMPDSQGYFRWDENINLYMEVLSWDKVLRDAELRNKIFFQTLGI